MKIVMTSVLTCVALVFVSLSVTAEPAGLDVTALDRYVAAPDNHYKYEVTKVVKGDGYTSYIIDMVSQQWLTEKEVDLPIWVHVMTVTVPDTVTSDIGYLYITGGDKMRPARDSAPGRDIVMAKETQTVVTTLYMVPNQGLVFVADETRTRYEDAVIAYAWDKYLRGGGEKWLVRLPMTKSAVRAMDTVTDFMASEQGGKKTVDKFVVSGESKRGWTTWTTAAVDKRVIAIMPVVIDMLNLEESFKHHYEVYGEYARAVHDYTSMGLMKWMGTPEYTKMLKIVEPYQYRARLTLPKFILSSTGDQFFLPDSWQFYWDDLVGEKDLRYVPNSDHSITSGTDAFESMRAWYDAIVHNVFMPRYTWDVADDGTITVFSLDKPTQVLLWQAHNPDKRDFRKEIIGRAYTSTPLQEVEPGKYVVKLDAPKSGYTAYYVEMEYPSGLKGIPFKFSTGIKIVPDIVEYKWKKASKKDRLKEPRHR